MNPRTPAESAAAFDRITDVIQTRRTSMFVDRDRDVPLELVTELAQLATWAPNHKKTWPWRFAYFTGDGRTRLGETMVDDMVAADVGDEGKRAKTAVKYERTPGIVVVGCAPHDNAMLHDENRDAVAAAIQNFLLAASTLGLATFWSTPALTSPPSVLELCGFDPGDRIVGIIYLGWSDDRTCDAPKRPAVTVRHVSG